MEWMNAVFVLKHVQRNMCSVSFVFIRPISIDFMKVSWHYICWHSIVLIKRDDKKFHGIKIFCTIFKICACWKLGRKTSTETGLTGLQFPKIQILFCFETCATSASKYVSLWYSHQSNFLKVYKKYEQHLYLQISLL